MEERDEIKLVKEIKIKRKRCPRVKIIGRWIVKGGKAEKQRSCRTLQKTLDPQ
jgi:hypothetical protein